MLESCRRTKEGKEEDGRMDGSFVCAGASGGRLVDEGGARGDWA